MYDDDFRVLDVVYVDGLVVVVLEGEIDIASAPALRSVLDQLDSDCKVILDLARVAFMDCSGLRILVGQLISRHSAGGVLRIRNSSVDVRRLVEITGLDDLLLEATAA